MKICIVCMGKTRERFVREGIVKYVRFLKPYADVEIRELKEEKIQDLREAPRIRKKEAERIGKAVPAGAYVVALDERGEDTGLARYIGDSGRRKPLLEGGL